MPPRAGATLYIRQFRKCMQRKIEFHLFVQSQAEYMRWRLHDTLGMIELMLEKPGENELFPQWDRHLLASDEQQQVGHLLVSYFRQGCFEYSVDKLLEGLVDVLVESNPLISRRNTSIDILMTYMDNQIDRPMRMRDFSKFIHFSESSLNRLCKKETGKTVMAIFRERKLERAKILLATTTLSIREISGKLGYKSSQHFSTMYKQFEGETPLEFRKKSFNKKIGKRWCIKK